MGFRPALIMLVLAALSLSGALYLACATGASGAASLVHEQRALLSEQQLPARVVTKITLRRPGEPALVFERAVSEGSSGQTSGGGGGGGGGGSRGWTQTEPFAHPVDAYSIDQFLTLAQAAQVLEVTPKAQVANEHLLPALALDPPSAVLRYDWPGGSLELDFGRRGIAGRAYLRIDGDENVYVVNPDLQDRAVTMDPKEWRDRRLFAPTANASGADADGEPMQITLVAGDQRIALERERRKWSMTEPARTRVDAGAIGELLSAVSRATCSGFVLDQPGDLSRFGLDPSAGSLEIVSERSARADSGSEADAPCQRLLIGSTIGVKSSDRFGWIEGRPVVLRLSAAVLAALFPGKESLAQPTACGVVAADVKTIRIDIARSDFRLERDLERWLAPDHEGVEVPAAAVNELLSHLTELRATRVVFAAFPREKQVAHVTLIGFSGRPLDTVRIARDPATKEWAMDSGDNVQRIYPAGLELRLDPPEFGLPQVDPGQVPQR